jgi:hypothetical protein
MQTDYSYKSNRVIIGGVLIFLAAAAFSLFTHNNYSTIETSNPPAKDGLLNNSKISRPVQPQASSSILEKPSKLQLQPAPATGQSRHNPQAQSLDNLNKSNFLYPPPLP